MPVPSTITDLSAVAASNSPSGTDSPNTLDDIQRAHASFIRQLHDGTTKPAWSAAFRIPFFDPSGNYGSAATFVRDAAGNVGIGTSNPAAPLAVSDGSVALESVPDVANGVVYLQGINRANTLQPCDLAFNAPRGNVVFRAGNAGGLAAERMRIDSSGNVGIGTAPLHKLTIGGVNAAENWMSFKDGPGNLYAAFGISSSGGVFNIQSLDVVPMAFSTNGLERMRIDASGNVLVGTTNNTGRLTVEHSGASVVGVALRNTDPSGSAQNAMLFVRNGAGVGAIVSTSSSTSYNTSSDHRLKHDVQPITGALASVMALRPVTYRWNVDNSAGEGFIAHELAEVCPQAVTGEKDAVDEHGEPVYQGIDTSHLVGRLVAAIQEQQRLIERLEQRLAAAGIA